jgi:hypothetical protein
MAYLVLNSKKCKEKDPIVVSKGLRMVGQAQLEGNKQVYLVNRVYYFFLVETYCISVV